STQNLFIEGDNLESLKLLQKSLYGKVKMIYIDPPYNTGTDHIYRDNYRDSIANYQAITGQVAEDGLAVTSSSETTGRLHTAWLNMMYPRLRLARNLLRSDGVIGTAARIGDI
ncbi:MAG: DNA methyltransferase, partial [Microbacterium sp.]|uniref:DNA methyltransferase n=1 Tax=Microbacterium sp. TaxID=51671 RepID=UPI0027225987